MGILEEIRKRRVFFDGGMGSLLLERGLSPGEPPEVWNLTHPDLIEQIHLDYLEAGADVVKTNTFGAGRLQFRASGDYKLGELVKAAVGHARRAVERCEKSEDESGKRGYVALDLGPTGELLKPLGSLDFEEAYQAYRKIAEAGATAGADCIAVETMGDCYELKAAVLAAKEAALPVFATASFDERGKMLTGGDVEAATALLEGLGADVIGMNCGLGPEQTREIAVKMAEAASVPILVSPNAGLPRYENGAAVYEIGPGLFAAAMKEIAESASVLGGCCGTTPEHIRELVKVCRGLPLPPVTKKGRTVVSSYSHAVIFGEKPVLIGERINPTGKPRLIQALRERDMEPILRIGVEQRERRAGILDVNVGLPEIDEPSVMAGAVKELQSVLDLPLQIDTSNIEAMERAMRVYNGKPLINSVNGRREVMEAVFPLMKRYGGVAVALCLDEDGIPATAAGRIAVAKKIYRTAEEYGIGREEFLIDALCTATGSDQEGALTTLETVRRIREELGGKTVLGVSNISFGLPRREQINAAYLTMALQSGLSAAIVNPNSEIVMAAYDSYLALAALDQNCENYISVYGAGEAVRKRKKASGKRDEIIPIGDREKENERPLNREISSLKKSIIRGMPRAAAIAAKAALETGNPLDIIDGELIPALNEAGQGFENGTRFLPQLLMSAEAAKAAFAALKEGMEPADREENFRGTVILATVKGDIHDIGKNIVKVLLENYGFAVVDLGRDVPPEAVVCAAVGHGAGLVGLSALMTASVPSMAETVRRLKEELPDVKVMVGGAVLTQEYADSIGADCYCRDAMASVRYAECIFNKKES